MTKHTEPPQLEQWRSYLRTLARAKIGTRLQAKIDQSDIVQQTMLEAHCGLSHFRGTSQEELRGWLRRILVRNLADQVRRFRRGKRDAGLEYSLDAPLSQRSSLSLDRDRYLAGNISSPEYGVMHSDQLTRLAAALESLPDDQRSAVTLRYLEGMATAQIGQEMQRTEAAVAGLLRRGLQRLRDVMQVGAEH